jgi:integration host factor subunit alpha
MIIKADLKDQLVKALGYTHIEAQTFVNEFFSVMSDTLSNGCDIRLSSFGNFTLHKKSSRPGLNPKTKEVVTVTARTVVTFKPGSKMKIGVCNSAKGQNLITDLA